MAFNDMVIAIVFLPLIAAAVTGLFVRSIPDQKAQYITCGFMSLAAILSGIVFKQVIYDGAATNVMVAPWIVSGDFALNWSLKVDVLTAVMFVVVTWVSAVVHIYSVGYMSHDPHKPRFMAYLSLFTFAMLMLVSADNFVQLFFGWEGVGLCSYLLIGFWFQKDSANAASMKAFIVNRVGDFGLVLGVLMIFLTFDSVVFEDVFSRAPEFAAVTTAIFGYQIGIIDVACILLFVGAMGKSAQLLLHTWLPDAMEGPTPVSALIHAATMVTAGVFLVARCSPLFEYAPNALMIVTLVGGLTSFFAATIGLTQFDIKRVIAYSTCSQLGYMFFACGVSAYAAGVFHLMTHAFFKALLFLCAGSVIHAMSNEQDMRHMGGLWKKIPKTYAMMWIGSLALAGLPFFSGYYSKDIIIEAAFASGTTHGMIAFYLGLAAALMTAFYSFRLLFMTFHGESRASKEVQEHVHESPRVMLLPLLLLVAGALFAGMYGYKAGMVDASGEFWRGAITVLVAESGEHILDAAHHVPGWVIAAPIILAVLGIGFAFVAYILMPDLSIFIARALPGVHRFFYNKWYFDELYDALFVRSSKRLGTFLWHRGDEQTIDGFGPNGMALLTTRIAGYARAMQTGFLYHYAFVMLIGVMVMLTWLYLSGSGLLVRLLVTFGFGA